MYGLPSELNQCGSQWTISKTRIQNLTRFLDWIVLRDLREYYYDEDLSPALLVFDKVLCIWLEGFLDCCLDLATMVS